MKRIILILVAALSCGFSECDKEMKSENTTYSYWFSEDDCETGWQEYKTDEQKCAMLVDDELNNHCAAELRLKEVERLCGPYGYDVDIN